MYVICIAKYANHVYGLFFTWHCIKSVKNPFEVENNVKIRLKFGILYEFWSPNSFDGREINLKHCRFFRAKLWSWDKFFRGRQPSCRHPSIARTIRTSVNGTCRFSQGKVGGVRNVVVIRTKPDVWSTPVLRCRTGCIGSRHLVGVLAVAHEFQPQCGELHHFTGVYLKLNN